jgi:hypothetical protein
MCEEKGVSVTNCGTGSCRGRLPEVTVQIGRGSLDYYEMPIADVAG